MNVAWEFNDSTSRLELGSAVATALPLTFACWFSNISGESFGTPTLISVMEHTGVSFGDGWALGFDTGNPFRVMARTQTNFSTGTSLSLNGAGSGVISGWHHAAATFVSNASRTAWLDGIPGTVNTTNVAPNTPTRTNLGARYIAGALDSFYHGMIADAAIWNVELSPSEIAALASGVRPSRIRQGSLLMYLPLLASLADVARANVFVNTAAYAVRATPPKLLSLGSRFEIASSPSISAEIGLASETDTAFAITALKTGTIGLAEEADSAFAITAGRLEALGLATETDSAFAVTITITHVLNLGLASETDTAFAIASSRGVILGLALEHDIALPMRALLIGRQRWLIRTAHLDVLGEMTIDSLRLTIKRGIGSYDREPHIRMRVNRDNKGFGRWISRGLGLAGDRVTTLNFGGLGTAVDWQFEFEASEQAEIELQECEAIVTRLGH